MIPSRSKKKPAAPPNPPAWLAPVHPAADTPDSPGNGNHQETMGESPMNPGFLFTGTYGFFPQCEAPQL